MADFSSMHLQPWLAFGAVVAAFALGTFAWEPFAQRNAERRERFKRSAAPIVEFLLAERIQFCQARAVPQVAQIELLYDNMPFLRGERWLREWARFTRTRCKIGQGKHVDRQVYIATINSCLKFLH